MGYYLKLPKHGAGVQYFCSALGSLGSGLQIADLLLQILQILHLVLGPTFCMLCKQVKSLLPYLFRISSPLPHSLISSLQRTRSISLSTLLQHLVGRLQLVLRIGASTYGRSKPPHALRKTQSRDLEEARFLARILTLLLVLQL